MPFAGGAETDRAASIAGVELVERAHATDRARIVGTVEQSAMHPLGRHQIKEGDAGLLVAIARLEDDSEASRRRRD
jgi:hypothetical protein